MSKHAELSKISNKEREFHRKIGTKCFNQAWDYLEMKRRSIEDDQQMLCLAHSSRYHWILIGTAKNRAIADWQVSRVYAALGQSELALQFAKSSLATFERGHLCDMVHTGNEAMARAYAVAKDYRRARRYLNRARNQLEKLTTLDPEGKKIYLGQIRDTELLIKGNKE